MASKSDSRTMRCSYCGTEVEVNSSSSGCKVSCCGEPMKSPDGNGSSSSRQESSSSRPRKGRGK